MTNTNLTWEEKKAILEKNGYVQALATLITNAKVHDLTDKELERRMAKGQTKEVCKRKIQLFVGSVAHDTGVVGEDGKKVYETLAAKANLFLYPRTDKQFDQWMSEIEKAQAATEHGKGGRISAYVRINNAQERTVKGKEGEMETIHMGNALEVFARPRKAKTAEQSVELTEA